jgi:two-component system phosphate regulon sensor histidine kinase PhoR
LKDCYDETLQLFKQKQQKLTLEVWFEHLVVQLDRSKLLQVFINLLWNAQKFTPEKGTIHIKAETENHILKIHIIDDGIGIKKVDLKRIFEKFQQAKGSLTRNISGTGLWLPIARNIIEQMWWQLQVESEPWKWSDFIVEIPILEK